MKLELAAVADNLQELGRQRSEVRSPEAEAEAALGMLDVHSNVTADENARQQLPGLLAALGVRIGLNFAGGMKGKRVVRKLMGGVIAFGDEPLPVPLHGNQRIENQTASNESSRPMAVENSTKTMDLSSLGGNVEPGTGNRLPTVGPPCQHD